MGVPHNHGKRYKKEPKTIKKKVFGIIFTVIVAIILSSIVLYNLKKEANLNNQTKENIMNTDKIEENDTENQNGLENEIQVETIEIDLPDKMGNYNVIGELVIEKIGVKNNILNNVDGLDLSVTKLCGPDINKPGNFCIIGHNYSKMFKKLNELEKGDTFYIIGKEEHTKITYEIYNIYTCNPKDLKCLNQNKDGKKEVTLITCNPGGLTRLICKAKEV